MLNVGKIKLRDIKELQEEDALIPNNVLTPLRKRKNLKSALTNKKPKEEECDNKTVIDDGIAATTTLTRTSRKKLLKSALKETPSNQKRIDSYFTSCPKTYDIKFPKENPSTSKGKCKSKTTKTKAARSSNRNKKGTKSSSRSKGRRKRLFTDSTEASTENVSVSNSVKSIKKMEPVECITLDSDSEEENNIKTEIASSNGRANTSTNIKPSPMPDRSEELISSLPSTHSSLSFGQRMSKTSCPSTTSITDTKSFSRRKPKPCPPYKVIENTTFAVDAFQFGYITNVTHYFLTHFHADHYIGLTKSFAMPLYMSPITARLLRKFIPVEEEYIHELELNQPCIINNMEITALDANHCPGAILIVFKFLDTGKCILHTGDFRACHEMESEPIFWNNHIHTIYLDTTYISDKYAFCTQYESIMRAQDLIEKFIEKHAGKRILYICGSYIVGKEKFWSSLAEKYDMKVWAEGNRLKALKAMNEEQFNRYLVADPKDADMHVIPMGKLSYLELVEYFKMYEQQYDIIFAMRPSGWEKDSKPRYGNKINVVGIEYSEHSSYAEMQRFVKFLKPDQVISTVPHGRNYMTTATVPTNWYKYDTLKASSNYQPSIQSFLSKTPQTNGVVRLPNINKGGVEYFVSPLKPTTPKESNNNNNSIEGKKPCSASAIATQPNEKVKELNGKNKKSCATQNSSTHLPNNKTIAKTRKRTRAISITNSSEDFETSDVILATKNKQRNKKNLQGNNKNNNSIQTKPQCNKKYLTYNTNIKLDSEEYFETPEEKLKDLNTSQLITKEIVKANGKTTKLHYSTEDESNTETATPAQQKDMENSISQRRTTRSKTALIETAETLGGSQSIQRAKNLDSKLQLNCTTSQRNSISKSLVKSKADTTSTDEWQPSDESMVKQANLEIPISQKRITRSKSASTKTTNASHGSQNKIEKEFESKLLKLTQQNNQIPNTTSKSNTNFNTPQENAIFKSTTDSNIDPSSADEMQLTSFKPKLIKLDSPTSSENWMERFQYPTKSDNSKRHALNHDFTALKNNKSSMDTKTLLNTILKQNDDLDRFNCSQLAGLVVETVNKQNPDYSKDHIPAELLSDADDDWM